MFVQWDQLKHAIPTKWKALISNYNDIDRKKLYQKYHINKEAKILSNTNYPLRKYIRF